MVHVLLKPGLENFEHMIGQKEMETLSPWLMALVFLICVLSCSVMSNSLRPHASKVILKILQARLQQYVNHELPGVQTGFRKGRGTRDQTANICWIIEKAREYQKNIFLCFIDYAKAFDCVDHNKLWKILQETGIINLLLCLLLIYIL